MKKRLSFAALRALLAALLVSSLLPLRGHAQAVEQLLSSGYSVEIPKVSQASEAPGSREAQQWLSLDSFRGRTLQQFLTAPNGLKAELDKDAKEKYPFRDGASFLLFKDQFDPLVFAKLSKSVKGGDAGVKQLADALAGATATPVTSAGPIADKLKTLGLAPESRIGLTAVTFAPVMALASGAGVPVMLDQKNYFLNIGYKSGANPAEVEKDVKSGRSYGAGPVHKPLDVSDVYYLKELHQHLYTVGDPAPFFKVMLDIVTRCDASGLASQPPLAQQVLTDLTAVYLAEMDRNAMTGFKKHAWQNDLAEATMISAFTSPAEQVVLDSRLTKGSPVDFFGVGTNGSGIGIRRKDRRMLQLSVVNYERRFNPAAVAEVEKIIGKTGGDLFHNLMLFINRPDSQAKVAGVSQQLSAATAALLAQIYRDAPAITAYIQQNGLPIQAVDQDAANETSGHCDLDHDAKCVAFL